MVNLEVTVADFVVTCQDVLDSYGGIVEFELIAGSLALDFANTVHSHGLPDPEDDLKTLADRAEWGVQAGLWEDRTARSLGHAEAAAQSAKLRRVRRLREVVYALFVAIARGEQVPAQT